MGDIDMLPGNTGLTSSQENFPQNMALEHFPGNIKGENFVSTTARQHEKQNAYLLNAKHCANFSIIPDYNEHFEMVMEVIDSDTSYKPENTVCASQCTDNHRLLEIPNDNPYIPVTGSIFMTSKDIIDKERVVDLKKKADVQKKLQVVEVQMESKEKDYFNMENQEHLHVPSTISLQNSDCANTNDTSQENYSISLNSALNVSLREMKGTNNNNKKVEDELDDSQLLLPWYEGNIPLSDSILFESNVIDCQSQGFDDRRNVFHGQRNRFDGQSKAFGGKTTRVDNDQSNTLNGSCNTCYGQSKVFDGLCKSSNDQSKIFGGLCNSLNGQSKAFDSKNHTFDVQSKTFNGHSNDLVGQNDVHAFDGQNQSFDAQNSGLNGESNAFNGQNDTFHVQNSGLNGESSAFDGQNDTFHVQNSGLNGERNAFNDQNDTFHVQNSGLNGESNAFDGDRRINNVQSNVSDCYISTGVKISQAEVCSSIDKTDSQPMGKLKVPVINLSVLQAAIKNGLLKDVVPLPTKKLCLDDSMTSFADTNVYPKKLAEPAGLGYPADKCGGLDINMKHGKQHSEANIFQTQQFKMVNCSSNTPKSLTPHEMSTSTHEDDINHFYADGVNKPVQRYMAEMPGFENRAKHNTFSVNTTGQSQITSSHTSGTMLSTESDVASLSENQNISSLQNPRDSILEDPGDANHCKIKTLRGLRSKIQRKRTNSYVFRHQPYKNDRHLLPKNLPEFEN